MNAKKESKTLTATKNEKKKKKYCGGGKDEESYEQKSYWFVQKQMQKSGSVSPAALEKANGKVSPIITDSTRKY